VSFLSAKKVCGLGGPVSEIEMLYYALDEESTDQKYTIYALIVAKRVTESVNDLAMRSVGAIARRFTLRIPVSPLSTGSQFSSSSCPMIVNGFICPLFKAWKEQGEGEGVQIEAWTSRSAGSKSAGSSTLLNNCTQRYTHWLHGGKVVSGELSSSSW
jgi:hypothetical protein